MSKEYQVQVDDKHLIHLSQEEIHHADIQVNKDGSLHILHKNKSFKAELIHLDRSSKKLTVKINAALHEVKLKDDLDMLIEKMGMKVNQKSKSTDIIAPMPGLVLKIMVESGQPAIAGQPILILEAMKMENVLKADSDGIIKDIKVTTGTSVDKGQLLVVIEPASQG